MKSRIGTVQWNLTLQSRSNCSAPGFKACHPPSSALLKEQVPRARSRATEALNDAEEAVKRNPLAVVAIALGLGLLIGVLTRR